jgi:membrane-bound ClpP family serine protease
MKNFTNITFNITYYSGIAWIIMLIICAIFALFFQANVVLTSIWLTFGVIWLIFGTIHCFLNKTCNN